MTAGTQSPESVYIDPEIKSGAPVPLGRVDQVVAEIRQAPLARLRDPLWLQHYLLPKLGLNGEILNEFPEELYPWCGYGVRSWQYPAQFSKYLVYLSGKQIRTYLEIGCRHGGTFIITAEYLKRFNHLQVACALDIEDSAIMREYKRTQSGVAYALISSLSDEGKRLIQEMRWDLALIDGDHSYEACSADYETVRDHARLIALHDIVSDACPGVKQLWQELKRAVPLLRREEFVDQYENVVSRTGRKFLGMGVVDFS
jgi:cephalosporin hydroxylase